MYDMGFIHRIGLLVMLLKTWRWSNSNGGMRFAFPALPILIEVD